jgi:hypothetical protein
MCGLGSYTLKIILYIHPNVYKFIYLWKRAFNCNIILVIKDGEGMNINGYRKARIREQFEVP